MSRFIGLLSVGLIGLTLSGCCGPTQFFRCGACVYDNCVVPTAQSPALQPEIVPDAPSPTQASTNLSMSY